jgi:hypothetical protein
MIKRRTKAAMIVVLNRHKTEGLQNSVCHFPHGAEDFGHAMHRASLRLEGNFDKVALGERLGQTEQSSGHGNGLEVGFGAAAIFEPDRSQNRVA